MAFIKGVSGNPSGRPKVPAIPKTIEHEVRELARRLFDADYWARTKRLLMKGELNPRLEIVLLAYAYGPADKDQTTSGVTVNVGFLTSPPPAPALEPASLALTLPSELHQPVAQILASTPDVP